MTLDEMKKIAEARTIRNIKKLVVVDSKADSEFIAMAANNWDKLMAVVEAAYHARNRLDISLAHAFEKVEEALKALEAK